MPEYLKALVVILILAGMVFWLAKASVCELTSCADFRRRRNAWFFLTALAFLAHSFWIYLSVGAAVLLFLAGRDRNKAGLFLFLLFIIPPLSAEIPGLAGINKFIAIDHIRLLEICILIPAWLALRRGADRLPLFASKVDVFVLGLVAIKIILNFSRTSFTDALRESFYAFADIFLPYFVVSRGLRDRQLLRDALLSLVIAAAVLAAIAVFEYLKGWLLYADLMRALGLVWQVVPYVGRAGHLRASASATQPIALGYVLMTAFGFLLALWPVVGRPAVRRTGLALLTAGLAATLSRGPWLGLAVFLVIFRLAGSRVLRVYSIPIMLALAGMLVFQQAPGVRDVVGAIPFIGKTDMSTVDYRQRLFTNSMQVIGRHPWFGSADYFLDPAYQDINPEHNIDVVNTYIQIGFTSGLVGVCLFLSIFLSAVIAVQRALNRRADAELDNIGRALIASYIATLVVLGTVSSISFIPTLYWSLIGMGVAYVRIARSAQPAITHTVRSRHALAL